MNELPGQMVDDEVTIRQLLGAFLEEEGYPVYEAADDQEAQVRLRTHPEGLVVLLDLLMPRDGIATLQIGATDVFLATQYVYILMTAVNSPSQSK